MMFLAAQTTLVLGIIQAVVAVPQHFQWPLNQQRPSFLQPLTASGQQNNFGEQVFQGDVLFDGDIFPVASNFNKVKQVAGRNNVGSTQQSQSAPRCSEGQRWKQDCNDCTCDRGKVLCSNDDCTSINTAQINTVSSNIQLGWVRETNGCIIGNDDKSFNTLSNLNDCKAQCQAHSECRSVEFNTENGRCNLSRATSRHPNYQRLCPGKWFFSELIEITPQITVQTDDRNQPSSNQVPKPDKFEQVGLSPSPQSVGSQTIPAHAVQQNRPVNTNPQQPPVQQPGFPSSQNGRPQNPQNDANQGNAASSIPQHFRPATQHATHNGNQQGGQTTQPARPSSSQGGRPQPPQSGVNPSNVASSSSQSSGTANGSPVSGHPGSPGATSGSSQQRAPQCFRTPSPGECRGAFPRFFYNKTLDQCDCFLYGGCGNEALESSWLTNAECNEICRPRILEEGPRCKLLPKQDIQTFTQASISPNVDSSNLTDGEFIDALSASDNKNPQNNQFNNQN